MFIRECDAAPGSNLDYGFDYSDWLSTGETITDSDWKISPTATLSSEQNVSGVCSVFVATGAAGTIYTLTNTITTSDGRIDARTLVLSCKNK